MATRGRIVLRLTILAGAVLIASVALALSLFNLNRYRSAFVSYFEEKSGKTTHIDRLALTYFPRATIHIYGLAVESPPQFPPSDVVDVAEADAEIDPWSLLHGAVVITSLALKGVVIDLLSAPDGHWNFENPRTGNSRNTFPMAIVDRVTIDNAQLTISDLLPSGAIGPAFIEAHDIASQLRIVNLAAIVNPSSPSLNGQGRWQVGRVRVGPLEATEVNSSVRLDSSNVSIADVNAAAYRGTIAGDFSLSLAAENAGVTADARMTGIDVAPVLAAFREERASVTGTLDGALTLAGTIEHTVNPLAGLRGTGHVRVTNGDVPSLLTNADMKRLASFNDLGPGKESPSAFSSIAADLQLANLQVSSHVINIAGHGVDVEAAGSVSVSGSNALNYRGVATITTKQGFWTNMFARFGGGTLKNGTLSFPFRIEGTIENPKVSRPPKGG